MFNTELGRFCAEHENWEELLIAEPYYIKIKQDGLYFIFNYDQIRSDFSLPIVREARGIIFKEGHWENPVCWAFNKFGNYGESYVPDINWETAFVSEKIDGSLMKVWWDGTWHISTNGTIDAFKAELGDIKMPDFGTYFIETLVNYYNSFGAFTAGLSEDFTYMFELVGPYNRVVIPYNEPTLYFLGARNKFTGEEVNCSSLSAGALGMGRFKLPKSYALKSLTDCIAATEKLGWDDEGFVVCDAEFNRVKVKSPAYVLAHFARNNNVITRRHLIKVILAGELEEFLCYAADYKAEILACKAHMDAYLRLSSQIVKAFRELRVLPRGEYAKLVKTFPKIFQGLLFFNYDRDMTIEEYTANWNENKWEACLSDIDKIKDEYFSSIFDKYPMETKGCDGCCNIAFRYPYASMYPCTHCVRANSKDYYNVHID